MPHLRSERSYGVSYVFRGTERWNQKREENAVSELVKVTLSEDEMPRQWYNLQADFENPMPPPLGPDGVPIGPDALAPIFPMNLIEQEVSQERWIDIPEEVMSILKIWRPTPMYRAKRLEEHLGTPAKIYYKNEGVSPPGSHKPNTAIAQAYYNRESGTKRLTTETGAGQWGCAPLTWKDGGGSCTDSRIGARRVEYVCIDSRRTREQGADSRNPFADRRFRFVRRDQSARRTTRKGG